MERLLISAASGACSVVLGGSFDMLPAFTDNRPAVVVTDSNVLKYYRSIFNGLPIITLPCGEGGKTLETVESIYEQFLKLEVDRSWLVVAVGGGIVCDTAAYAAATWMRGIACGLVPTTLLAMVDAAIGGKNGVNYHRYKNLIGTIRQPEFVLIDTKFLETLPRSELLCGFAEMIKHGAIADHNHFAYLEKHAGKLLALDGEVLPKAVADSAAIKSRFVLADEQEKGERKKLNFGHTVGHALEKTMRTIRHGEAVAIGMAVAAGVAESRFLLAPEEKKRLISLIEKFGLPVTLPTNPETLLEALGKDKKRRGGALDFILLEQLGSSLIQEVTLEELRKELANLYKHR